MVCAYLGRVNEAEGETQEQKGRSPNQEPVMFTAIAALEKGMPR
jgi:hypothetical protein